MPASQHICKRLHFLPFFAKEFKRFDKTNVMKDEIDRLRDDVFSSSASSERRRASLLSLNPFLLLGSFLYTSSCHISMCFSLRGPEEARILALGLLSDVRLPDRPCTLFLQRSEEPVPGRSCWFRAVPGAILKLFFLFLKSFFPSSSRPTSEAFWRVI